MQQFALPSQGHRGHWVTASGPRLPPRSIRAAAASSPSQGAGQLHVVKAGETLTTIAQNYGISVRELKAANKQELYARGKARETVRDAAGRRAVVVGSDIIYPGQSILVPVDYVPTTVAAQQAAARFGGPAVMLAYGAAAVLAVALVGRLTMEVFRATGLGAALLAAISKLKSAVAGLFQPATTETAAVIAAPAKTAAQVLAGPAADAPLEQVLSGTARQHLQEVASRGSVAPAVAMAASATVVVAEPVLVGAGGGSGRSSPSSSPPSSPSKPSSRGGSAWGAAAVDALPALAGSPSRAAAAGTATLLPPSPGLTAHLGNGNGNGKAHGNGNGNGASRSLYNSPAASIPLVPPSSPGVAAVAPGQQSDTRVVLPGSPSRAASNGSASGSANAGAGGVVADVGNMFRTLTKPLGGQADAVLSKIQDINRVLEQTSAPPAPASSRAVGGGSGAAGAPGSGARSVSPVRAAAAAASRPAAAPLPPTTASPAYVPPFESQVKSTPIKAGSGGGGGAMPPPRPKSQPRFDPYTDATILNLKSGLLDVVYGTARGVRASNEQRSLIDEYVCALECRNPYAVPTDAIDVLEGRWKLIYTSNTQTLMLLNALDSIPLVDIGDVYQVIDAKNLVAQNKIDVAMPVLLSLRAEAALEVRTPRQFKVRFQKVGLDTYIETPQVLSSLEIPESVSVLGTSIDLTPLRQLIVDPVNSGIETAQNLLHRAVSAPELPVSPSELTSLWMLTTYLDDTLRVSRDDSGRVFVMLKDVTLPRKY